MKSSFKVLFAIVLFGLLLSTECSIRGRMAGRLLQTMPAWAPGVSYSAGNMVTYNGQQYKCIQGHTSLPGWEPANVPALWGASGPAPQQNTTSNSTSTSNNSTTTSNSTSSSNSTSNNSTSSTNSSSSTNTSSSSNSSSSNNGGTATAQWAAGTMYSPGTVVIYQGAIYSCLQPHTAQPDWNPAAVASLWTYLSNQCTTIAAAPTGLSTTVTSTTITVSWSAVPLPDGCSSLSYQITVNGAVKGTATTTSYVIGGLMPATVYQIGVASVDNGGISASTKISSTTGPNPCANPPSVPTGFVASQVNAYSAMFNWTTVQDTPSICSAIYYQIYANGAFAGNSTGNSLMLVPLSAQTAYTFQIQAVGLGGSSAKSAGISVTTAVAPLYPTKVFAPYVDMGLANHDLVAMSAASGIKKFTMAFVVASGCQANWFGSFMVTADTTMGPLIKAIGVDNIIVSFGGASGTELALVCDTPEALAAQYQVIIDRYNVTQLDWDVEGGAMYNQASVDRRNKAIKILRQKNPGVYLSYTLPVLPSGLTSEGVNLLANAVANGVKMDVINIMAMDYGGPSQFDPNAMAQHAINAAESVLTQMASVGMVAKIGITPMIGLNDCQPENFTLADAQTLLNYAYANPKVSRLSMWSVARDNGGCVGSVSYGCSGVQQSPYAYAQIFNNYRD